LLERELKTLEDKLQLSEGALIQYAQKNGLPKDEKLGGVPQQRLDGAERPSH